MSNGRVNITALLPPDETEEERAAFERWITYLNLEAGEPLVRTGMAYTSVTASLSWAGWLARAISARAAN